MDQRGLTLPSCWMEISMIDLLLASYPMLKNLQVGVLIDEGKARAKQYRRGISPDSLVAKAITDGLAAMDGALRVTDQRCGNMPVAQFVALAKAGTLPADVRAAWESVAITVGIKLV